MYPSRPTHSASKTRMNPAIEVAAKRGKTGTALSAIESQKKARGAVVEERKRESAILVTLQTERAQVAAKGRQAETEAAPIRYVAEMLGADTDSERTIRWLIALNRGASHSRTKHGWTCLGATRSCIRACSGTDPRQTSRALRRWRSFVGLLKGRAKVDKPLHRHQRALGFQQCELV